MLSPRLPMIPQVGQWILSGSWPCNRAVATACVSCPGFHCPVSFTTVSFTADPSHPASRIVVDGTERAARNVSRDALSQIGEKQVHGGLLVHGDVGRRHGGAQRLVPRRGLGTPAQAKPAFGGKPAGRVDVVVASEPPGTGAAVEDAPGDGDAGPVEVAVV